MKCLTIDGWNVYDNTYGFYCTNAGKTLYFTAEYKNGIYFKIKSYYDGKRCYKASRYHFKFIGLASKITFELLKQGFLWDYLNNRPALASYKNDIEPYYRKCKELCLTSNDDDEFLDRLFN